MTASLPPAIQQAITAKPDAFLRLLSEVLAQPADLFVLVDKKHPLPSGFVPPDLVSLNDYPVLVTRKDLKLRRSIMPAVLALTDAAAAAGAPLTFGSSYRSYDYQVTVYENEVKLYGREQADRESARPGLSQHQLGTAMDFSPIADTFADTKQGKWLAAHAWEYGFSLSYPEGYENVTGYKHESWHYRYVTKPGALLQREYFGDIQQYMIEFLDRNRAVLEKELERK